MSKVDSFRCQPVPRHFDAVRFPNGGQSQIKIREWVKQHGGEANLYDGWVRETTEPADDGSYYRWDFISIGVKGKKYHSRHAYYGDYIIHRGDGDFIVVTPWEYDDFYEDVSRDV